MVIVIFRTDLQEAQLSLDFSAARSAILSISQYGTNKRGWELYLRHSWRNSLRSRERGVEKEAAPRRDVPRRFNLCPKIKLGREEQNEVTLGTGWAFIT